MPLSTLGSWLSYTPQCRKGSGLPSIPTLQLRSGMCQSLTKSNSQLKPKNQRPQPRNRPEFQELLPAHLRSLRSNQTFSMRGNRCDSALSVVWKYFDLFIDPNTYFPPLQAAEQSSKVPTTRCRKDGSTVSVLADA